jgi:hypothetical protein
MKSPHTSTSEMWAIVFHDRGERTGGEEAPKNQIVRGKEC